MEKNDFNLEKFMVKCETILPKYFLSKKFQSKKDLNTAKTVILSFLKEYLKNNNNKFNRNQFNVNYINQFLLSLYPQTSLLEIPLYKIQTIILDFINYLTLQDILSRNIQHEIVEKISKTHEIIEELSDNDKNKEIVEIKNKIIDWALNFERLHEDEAEFNRMRNYFEKKSKKNVMNAILELFKTIEDSNFQRILFFIDEFLKIETLPSKVLRILKSSATQNRYFFRLLMLYNTFFLAGYVVKTSFSKLLDDLNVDINSFQGYIATVLSYVEGDEFLLEISDSCKTKADLENFLNVDKYINEIVPIDNNTPFASRDLYTILFNLPKDINLELSHHMEFLESISYSYSKRMRFIKSSWDGWKDCYSDNEEQKLFTEAKEKFYNGHSKKALVLINKLIKKAPESAAAYYLKGKILGEQGAHYNALLCHIKSLEFDPYRIETYMDFSYLLEVGGYFHSSIILTSLLLQFCPFDFNLILQLAISSYQLELTFKQALKLAGLVEKERLINFVLRYWVHDRIKSRDTLNTIKIKEEKFKDLLKFSEKIISNAIKVMELYGNKIRDEGFMNHLNDLLRNSLSHFPNKEDHILKNWFVFELANHLAENFHTIYYENYFNLPYLIASEDFINLCFQISKKATNQILNSFKKSKNRTSFSIDYGVFSNNEDLLRNPIYKLARFFITDEGLFNTLWNTIIILIDECKTCPNRCLDKPYRWCPAFYMFGKIPSELESYSELISFIESLSSDFELTLEDKSLRQETINKKVKHIELFLTYLIKLIKEEDFSSISEDIDNYINEETLLKFLGLHIIKEKLITTRTSMKDICISLKSFISYLHNDYGYFSKNLIGALRKILNSSDYFIERFDGFQKLIDQKDNEVLLKEWNSQLKW
ncbi:MAG: hypothetical protein EU529_15120 [Promethearchaeota archaeon]|nr:MAG: hypothetical protein EU529_15120 [Candidatus Lokiarchaeota archaeon]